MDTLPHSLEAYFITPLIRAPILELELERGRKILGWTQQYPKLDPFWAATVMPSQLLQGARITVRSFIRVLAPSLADESGVRIFPLFGSSPI